MRKTILAAALAAPLAVQAAPEIVTDIQPAALEAVVTDGPGSRVVIHLPVGTSFAHSQSCGPTSFAAVIPFESDNIMLIDLIRSARRDNATVDLRVNGCHKDGDGVYVPKVFGVIE